MPLELNSLRMVLDEWEAAAGRHAKHRKAEQVRRIATPELLVILLMAYDEATEDAQRLRDRYEGVNFKVTPVQQEGGD